MKTLTTIVFILSAISLSYSQTEFKLDSIHQYSWSIPTDDWVHNTRDLYTYDNGGTKETNLLRLDLDGMDWENFYQYNKAYDVNNNLIESILQNWDNGWVNGSRDTYTYNMNDLPETFSYAIYTGGNWMMFRGNNYTYDVMNNLIQDVSTELDFATMMQINEGRLTYEYDSNNLKTTETEEAWRSFLNDWENEERKDYTYNTNNDLSLLEVNGWNIGAMEWGDPYRQTILTYNVNNLPIEIVEQVTASGNWLNTGRVLNTYDGNNLTVITSQTWNSGTDTWDNQSRQVRTFDANDNLVELIFESWDTGANDWQGFLRQVFFYSPPEALGIDEQLIVNDIKLYPNPTYNHISLKTADKIDASSVYNLQGQEILSYKSTNELSLPELPEGLYFLKMTLSKGEITKPFIIKH